MIDLITSMDYWSYSEFPKSKVLSQKMQANKTHIQINPNKDFEKSLWPLSRPLNLPSSPHQPLKLALR